MQVFGPHDLMESEQFSLNSCSRFCSTVERCCCIVHFKCVCNCRFFNMRAWALVGGTWRVISINNMQVKVNLLVLGLNFQHFFFLRIPWCTATTGLLIHSLYWTKAPQCHAMSILTWDQSPQISPDLPSLSPNSFRTESSGWKGDGGWHPTMQNDLNHPSASAHREDLQCHFNRCGTFSRWNPYGIAERIGRSVIIKQSLPNNPINCMACKTLHAYAWVRQRWQRWRWTRSGLRCEGISGGTFETIQLVHLQKDLNLANQL
jgi:hypothetical protein